MHHVLYHAHHTAATLLSCMSANRIVPTPTPCASAPRPASLAVAPTVLGSVGPRSEIPLPIHAVTAAKIYGRFPKYGNWLAAPGARIPRQSNLLYRVLGSTHRSWRRMLNSTPCGREECTSQAPPSICPCLAAVLAVVHADCSWAAPWYLASKPPAMYVASHSAY